MSDPYRLRVSRPSDLAGVDALLARSYARLLRPDYPPSVLVTALPLLSRAQPDLLACGTYCVVEDDTGQIVGAGGWTRDARRGHVGHVRHLVTDYTRVRQGIARRLIRYALTRAAASGVTCMECNATRTAVPFYLAMGFSVLGQVDIPLRPGISFPSVRMTRSLG